uniref:Uncharacterized protein n=1 Tax=Anguilla anguilla TaxID=7936 RepID=A0A0E9VQ71_ANGAN
MLQGRRHIISYEE